ncbi:amidohydrolase family protein [Amycolatopsis halotolerans]|uniref:6-methylsalicylate decarboxylase n=1 Tax=Amycolatopsis halotolerans TaxID=330083 RepID=A0ABV7QDM4_9PSEU
MTSLPRDGYIDIHAHFTLPATEDQARRAWQAMLSRGIYLPEPFAWSLDRTLDYLDRSGTAMQFLSNIPGTLAALRASNDYGAAIVTRHPARFGLLAALPTDDPAAALDEAVRGRELLGADGFAVTANYHGAHLGDDALLPLWEQLDAWGSVVFVHPDARRPPTLDHPAPLYEVAFETARTVFDMLFRKVFAQFPGIKFVFAHCGGAFPALAGRVSLLGNESWVPHGLPARDLEDQLETIYVDTAATAFPSSLLPAAATLGADHIVYGSDWGAPCTTVDTAEKNRHSLQHCAALTAAEAAAVRRRALDLFPLAARRLGTAPDRGE